MSVSTAVSRAMRSGGVITPREFPAIHREALAALNLSSLAGAEGYLLRGADAEALRGASFRNDSERREFYVTFLSQARDQVLSQLQAALSRMPADTRARRLSCHEVSGEGEAAQFSPAACFVSGAAGYAFRSGAVPGAGRPGFGSGLLQYLGETLPAQAFVGLPGDSNGFSEIQLLDGIEFTAENFQDAGLPAETRLGASALRLIYRANLCSEGSSLPDCR